MALRRVAIPSPNYSLRGGATVRLVVLHTAEGAQSYQSLGAFFKSPSAGVSSHVGIDDTPNTVGEYVQPSGKAWTCAAFNPVSIQAEICAFAAWPTSEWDRHPAMLANVAAWIREECDRFNLPIIALTPAQAQGGGRGVCQHKDLGTAGGGHHDCGPGFPMGRVLEMARGPKPPPTPTPPKDTMAIAAAANADGRMAVFVELADGSVKHCEQKTPNGDWWKTSDGSYQWLSLGNPSK